MTSGLGFSTPAAIAAGDFTGNGQLDLAIANYNDETVSVLLRNGDGTFQAPVTYAVGSEPEAIVAGDFTGNGQLDLAVVNAGDNTVSVLLGNGDGTFQPQVTYAVGSDPDAIVAGDFNGDGRLDLAVANANAITVSVLLGQRRRHLPAPGHLRVGYYARRDRGGRLHRRWPHSTWPSPTPAATPCRCCWATATARSSPRSPTPVGSDPDAIVAGDFTGDGRTRPGRRQRPDDTVSVLLGNGDGTFQPQVTYAVGSGPDAIVAGDFTGDGRLDLAVANVSTTTPCRCCWATATAPSSPRSPTRWGRTQTRSWRVTSTATAAPTSPSPTADTDTVSVLLGNGDGTFQPQVTYAVGRDPDAIVAGDFNGDGRTDLAVANYGRQHRVGAAGQRRRHLPAPGHLRGGDRPVRDRGG